ncbi:membrane-anchored mycosin MYCP [Streptoalloteichus tenebrarius]|uniref:Membrane-anchored mycosin MYCP n=1 Tax=Streptoalloteichus tenebrarius (strain ATCC 17920 / DSM 40477 / JCM 4838 / CBS 697.72 / NBRC 16177 / NCIMB 11028 / NRRL B-12390 / A12253. 1 / ISP 5477) TaxID=1933 RepID=A0ABT1HXV4_STRSD|nr:type VII secretion-associated serine protease mycosin [Streptoalloteichus tenebrarius]MCP2260210.1 membrane-anchored mycosin MYCP [Streptoalloteichus tenebrarius]BFF02588.1 type VII secretion-associated serine protease mycosin [Streptoalloteichus tenebrarius]
MRSPRSLRRLVAAAAAASLITLAGPVLPASAQPSGSDGPRPTPTGAAPQNGTTPRAGQEPSGSAKPSPKGGRPPAGDIPKGIPPLEPDMSRLPGNGPSKPEISYEKKNECIRALPDTAKNITQKPWGQLALNFEQVWPLTKGEGVKVAVIDTGVNRHPRLGDGHGGYRVEEGGDYVVEGEHGIKDCDGHGTAVAGIIAADNRDPSVGFSGVAPEATIISYRQSSPNYQGKDSSGRQRPAGTVETMAHAIRKAADAGAKVINVSESACQPPIPSSYFAPLHAAVRYAVQRNAVVVVAAGNVDGQSCKQNEPYGKIETLPSPAWLDDDVLTVAATDENGAPASFSLNGPWVDVAAPGTKITSLDPAENGKGLANMLPQNGKLDTIQGTSFAAPYVAGIVALVRARFPDLPAKKVIERIERTAQHPAGPGGWNPQLGWGMVDPVAAVTAVLPEEQGVVAPVATGARMQMPPATPKDWTPTIVALSGAGGGVVLLGITLFAVHTVGRVRSRQTRRAGT